MFVNNRFGRLSIILLGLSGCADAPPAPDAPTCGDPPVTLPILSAAGAVIVPVRIGAREAAATISPRTSLSALSDRIGLRLYFREPVVLGTITGGGYGRMTSLPGLRLGSLDLGSPRVAFRAGSTPIVDGRPVALAIGTDLLGDRRMLLDLPGRRVVLSCVAPALPAGGPITAVPLGEGNAGQIDVVHVELDRLPLSMEVNLSSNDTIVSAGDAASAGVSAAALATDPRERAGGTAHRLGHRHRFDVLRVGDHVTSGPHVDVQPYIAYDVLGLDFFVNKATVFDFPGRTLRFRDTTPETAPSRAAAFSGIASRTVETSVSDTAGGR